MQVAFGRVRRKTSPASINEVRMQVAFGRVRRKTSPAKEWKKKINRRTFPCVRHQRVASDL